MAVISYSETMVMKIINCANCNIPFAISEGHQDRLIENNKSFFCPNGHSQSYPQDNEAEKLRKELRRKEQELADTSIEKLQLRNQIAERDKKLKRLTNGVCPCCNRTFANLHQHMKKQHPEQVSKKR